MEGGREGGREGGEEKGRGQGSCGHEIVRWRGCGE